MKLLDHESLPQKQAHIGEQSWWKELLTTQNAANLQSEFDEFRNRKSKDRTNWGLRS